MSALARYYRSQGYTVAGYDRTPSPLTRQLEHEGVAIHYEDDTNLLPALIDFVVCTPAVPRDLKEFEALRQRNLPILKRAEALGKITEGHFTIAVAGTHGKTTTTAMVAHILHQCGVNTTAFIGGIANNFDSNLLLSKEKDFVIVVEADEFDRSFLHLHPDISIINSIDADHLDIYGDRISSRASTTLPTSPNAKSSSRKASPSKPTVASVSASVKVAITVPRSSSRRKASRIS